MVEKILNYVAGEWTDSGTSSFGTVINPASAELIGEVVMTPQQAAMQAVDKASAAFLEWRRVPVGERIQCLFKLKELLEANLDELARTITNECGKTYQESVAEMRRDIENVEVACGMPILMQGFNNEDIARGIDEHVYRQPLGVAVAITPFNFPGMIPLWFMPYAIATGNC